MELDKIIDFIEQALIIAPISFEAAANGEIRGTEWCADRMPESWIVAQVMQAAHHYGIAAVPEVRIRHDIEYFVSDGKRIQPDSLPNLKKGGAKIDLILGDESHFPGYLHLRVALEIKGPKSSWQQFRNDIERLRELHAVASEEGQAMVFAYVTCPLLDSEIDSDAKLLEQSTGIALSKFRIRVAAQDSCATNGKYRCRIYMHIMRGTKKVDA